MAPPSVNLVSFALIVCSVASISTASGNNETVIEAETRLLKKLLEPEVYDRRVRPARPDNKVTVKFGLSLQQILAVDVTKESVHVIIWENMEFQDPRLSWNESEFAGVNSLRVPTTDVWMPDITLYNNADDDTHIYNRYDGSDVVMYSSGTVAFLPIVGHTFACGFDLRKFPFDEHTCKMKFGSWTYSGAQLNLTSHSDTIDLSNYKESPIWDLKETKVTRNAMKYACCPEVYLDLDFEMVLRRHSSFYGWMYFAPMALLQILIPVLFMMPVGTAHRYVLGGSVLVSLTLMITNLDIIIPWSGGTVPIIGRYYMGVYVLISLALALSGLVTNFANRTKEASPIPNIAKRVVFGVFARVLCMSSVDGAKPVDGDEEEGEKSTSGGSREWQQMAHVLDRLFLVLFIILDIIVFLAFV